MPKNVFLQVNSSGCLTHCMHCWAQGKSFDYMPLSDVEEILVKAKEYFADKSEYKLWPFAMFEELAHPDTIEQIKLFRKYGQEPEEMATSGIALAVREDWRDILKSLKELEVRSWCFHSTGSARFMTKLLAERVLM